MDDGSPLAAGKWAVVDSSPQWAVVSGIIIFYYISISY